MWYGLRDLRPIKALEDDFALLPLAGIVAAIVALRCVLNRVGFSMLGMPTCSVLSYYRHQRDLPGRAFFNLLCKTMAGLGERDWPA